MKYFTINELSHSDTANKLSISNVPNEEAKAKLKALIDNVLDPLREAYGKPIKVNSGYRSAKLNQAIKGSTTSQHMKGEAADITGGSTAENKRLFELVKALKLPFDQLIDEKGLTWIHVSYGARNRRQVLTIK